MEFYLRLKELGEYAREKQYGDLLEKKLKEKKISYGREIAISNTGDIVDFLIDNKIIIELKTVRFLQKIISDKYKITYNKQE